MYDSNGLLPHLVKIPYKWVGFSLNLVVFTFSLSNAGRDFDDPLQAFVRCKDGILFGTYRDPVRGGRPSYVSK